MATTASQFSTGQFADASHSASFSETLASFQKAQVQEQTPNETNPSTVAAQPFQSGIALSPSYLENRADYQSRPEQGAVGDGKREAQADETQRTPGTKAAPEARKQTEQKEDIYVSNGAKGRAATEQHKEVRTPDGTQVDHPASDHPASDHPVEKEKQTKARGTSDGAAATSESGVPDAGTQNSGSTAPVVAGGQNVPVVNAALLTTQPGTPDATSARGGKGKGASADLAFAVKIQGSSAVSNNPVAPNSAGVAGATAGASEPTADAVAPNPFSAELRAMMAASGQKGSGNGSAKDGNGDKAAVPVLGTPGAPQTLNQASATAKPEAAAAVTEIPEDKATGGPNLKSVQVQVTGADNQRVDLRLVERSGALTISVRSADGSLTKALQQQLPELSNKLNEQQARTEWWTPEAPKVAAQKADQSNNDDKGNSGTQDQGNQDKGNSGQQGGRGARQPDWVEELADSRNSNQNGKQYTWHL